MNTQLPAEHGEAHGSAIAAGPMCDDSRDDTGLGHAAARHCLVCGSGFQGAGRGRYCSRGCQQQAYRLRQMPIKSALLTALAAQLHERQQLLGQTVYECPRCEQRLVAQRRCPDCNLMCRKLGLGGCCPHCDEPLLVLELLDGLM